MTDPDIREVVARHYPKIATELLTPLVRLLSTSRADLNGDLDRFLIIASIGLRTTSDPEFRRLTHEQLTSGDIGTVPGLGANIRSVADSLGLPRETARRKVRDLLESGWLVRRDNRLYLTSHALQRLVPAREQLVDFAARCVEIGARLRENDRRAGGARARAPA